MLNPGSAPASSSSDAVRRTPVFAGSALVRSNTNQYVVSASSATPPDGAAKLNWKSVNENRQAGFVKVATTAPGAPPESARTVAVSLEKTEFDGTPEKRTSTLLTV